MLNSILSAWTNPFNGVRGYVSYENTRFIIFWSKNPRPLLEHLHELKELNIGFRSRLMFILSVRISGSKRQIT